MPAATLGYLRARLSSFVGVARSAADTGLDFEDSLAEVLGRIYDAGRFRDTTYETTLTITDGQVSLPSDAEAVLFALVDDAPAFNRPIWHDYIQIGKQNPTPRYYGVVDNGWTVGTSDLADGGGYQLEFETEDGTNFTGDETIVVTFVTGGVRKTETLEPTSSVATISTTEDDIDSIVSISWDTVTKRTVVKLVHDTDSDLNNDAFGLIDRTDGVLRTRRYKVSQSSSSTTVRVLLKLKVPELVDDNTIVPIGNVSALKHGLLAKIAEDNNSDGGNLAEYHWAKCFQILDDELTESLGGQQHIVPIFPGFSPIDLVL